jgi:hypothetical protein
MIKVSEYMALEKPVVAFDLPEHRFTAQDAAVYARPNDELEMAHVISSLMDDPERRRELGRCGRQRVEQHLSWSRSVPSLLAAYEAVLSGTRSRNGGKDGRVLTGNGTRPAESVVVASGRETSDATRGSGDLAGLRG